MYRSLALPLFLLSTVVLGGCASPPESLVSPTYRTDNSGDASRTSASSIAGGERPYKGSCVTAITNLPPNPADPPNLQRLRIDGTCQLAHLGRTTFSAQQIVTFTGPLTATITNTATYTAADGDLLFASWAGSGTVDASSGIVAFSGSESFHGGTGRFVDAQGSASTSGNASLVTNTGEFTVVGTLMY